MSHYQCPLSIIKFCSLVHSSFFLTDVTFSVTQIGFCFLGYAIAYTLFTILAGVLTDSKVKVLSADFDCNNLSSSRGQWTSLGCSPQWWLSISSPRHHISPSNQTFTPPWAVLCCRYPDILSRYYRDHANHHRHHHHINYQTNNYHHIKMEYFKGIGSASILVSSYSCALNAALAMPQFGDDVSTCKIFARFIFMMS